MIRAARTDANQTEIVKGLRKIGASVLITSQLKNAFDILVGYRGVNYIMEIKDGNKPPSQRKLTSGELKFKESWMGGEYYVVESLDQAIEIVSNTNKKQNCISCGIKITSDPLCDVCNCRGIEDYEQ